MYNYVVGSNTEAAFKTAFSNKAWVTELMDSLHIGIHLKSARTPMCYFTLQTECSLLKQENTETQLPVL